MQKNTLDYVHETRAWLAARRTVERSRRIDAAQPRDDHFDRELFAFILSRRMA